MKCILHIGSPKTGTTALQSLLYDSQDELAKNGWLYPKSCLWRGDRSHNTLGIYFWDNFMPQMKVLPFEEVLNNLLKEIDGHENIIISTELIEKAILHGNVNTQTFLAALKERGYDINVVYVVRRQDYFVDSMFKQSVADPYAMFTGTNKEFIATQAPYIKYSRIAEAWRNTPGITTISVLPYFEGKSGNNINRFLEAMGQAETLNSKSEAPAANTSLDGIYLRLKHHLNRLKLPIAFHHRYNKIVLSANATQTKIEKSTMFTPESRKTFLEQYKDDFRTLEEKFGLHAEAWFETPEPDAVEFVPLTIEELPLALAAIDGVSVELGKEIRAFLN